MNSYWLAITISILGHSALVFFVVWGWGASTPPTFVKPPEYIKATLVKLEEKAAPVAKVQTPTPPKKPPVVDRSKADERKKQEQKKQQKQQRLDQLKAQKAEQERKNQLVKKQAEEKKQAEQKKKQKQERQRELAIQEQKKKEQQERERQQQALNKELAVEQARLKAEAQAANDAELVTSYNNLIKERISQNWNRPASARNGMFVIFRIQLIPRGDIIGVELTTSSGSIVYDRAAINAVTATGRIPELRELPIRVFEEHYRSFNLYFNPEDLRQ